VYKRQVLGTVLCTPINFTQSRLPAGLPEVEIATAATQVQGPVSG